MQNEPPRRLTPQDANDLAKLDMLCFGPESWSEAQIAGSIALTSTVGAGWRDQTNGCFIAFYLIQRAAPEAEILTLGVPPEHRGMGLGRSVLRHILDHAAKGCASVFLDVAADNAAARALYEKEGFIPFRIRPRYYQRSGGAVDAVNYRKTLVESAFQ